jgi:L-cysteine/cystine lyase
MAPDIAAVRAELPGLANEVHLNSGGAGPLPLAAARAISEAVEAGLAHGRMSLAAIEGRHARHEALRARVARLLGVPPREVAITSSATAGMGLVIWGIDWRPGDEAVTTTHEHPGLLAPLAMVAERRGVRLHLVEPEGDLEAAVGAVAGPSTRLVALSHVSWTTGARLDVEGAARAAARCGALVLVDGAQGAGAVPTEPPALGAHAYALAGQKWLLGPEGVGALWLAPDTPQAMRPSLAGVPTGTDHGPDGRFRPHRDARRMEVSTMPEMLLPGWSASLDWLEALGWDWIHGRTEAAAAALRTSLAEVPGVRLRTPPAAAGGLVAFTVDGREPEAVVRALAARGVQGRWIVRPPLARLSAGFFTDPEDIRKAVAALGEIVSRGG